MAGPGEGREERPEDLFEDLDKFFAPIKEDWPGGEAEPESESESEAEPESESESESSSEGEGLAAATPAGPPEGAAADLEDWAGPTIEIPDEDELVTAAPHEEPPGAHEPPTGQHGEPEVEATGAHEPAGAHEAGMAGAGEGAGGEATAGSEEAWLPEPTGEMSGDEWEAFRDALDEEGFRFDEAREPARSGTDQPGAAALPDEIGEPLLEEAPDHDAVEAAAEHFAEGFRNRPEEVERELLADLEEPAEVPGAIRVEPVRVDDEAPAWEEPAAGYPTGEVEVGEAAGVESGSRNLQAAVVSGALLAAAALFLMVVGKAWFAGLAVIVVVVGQGELYAVLRARGSQPATAVGLLIGLLMMTGAYQRGEPAVLFFEFLAIVLSVLWYMAAPPKGRRGTVANVASTILGVTYVPFLASYVLIILRHPGSVGKNLLLVVLGLTVLYDVCAYAVGSWWGSRQLAPTISPKKSWEGAIGATFILLIVALSIIPSIDPFSPASAVGLALVIAVTAPLGDLMESALKRDLGVKDMGRILPGHGGVLDRVDAILLTAPAAWYFFRLAGLL